MIEKLLAFGLVLTRVSAFLLVLPIFGWKTIPVRVKVALTFLLSVFFTLITPFQLNASEISELEAILLIANEATYGLALGLAIAMVFSAVKFSGAIIERQMGIGMVQAMNPMTGEQSRPLGSLWELLFIILFISAKGHHLFLLIICRSYETFPIGSIPSISVLTNGIVEAGATMFIAGLRLGAPILAAFVLLTIMLAVLARVVPQMNILFISLPIRVGLGLLMAVIFMPFLNTFVGEFAEWMGKLLPL
ncbi:MAG: flagellar biosynthetic protein FliR [Planctomycetota bacterium]